MRKPMNSLSNVEVGMARGQAKSSDRLFIVVWLVLCILLLFMASVFAARPPVKRIGLHNSELPIGASLSASSKREVLTANSENPQ